MRHWTSKQRAQRARRASRPAPRMDKRGPSRHPKGVTTGKDWNRLADYVLSRRSDEGMTQLELSQRMGVDLKTVRRIESGRSVAKTTVAAIDHAFNAPRGTARAALEGDDTAVTMSRGEAEVARIVGMTHRELIDEAAGYDHNLGEGAGEDWLHWAMGVRRRAKQIKPSPTRENAGRDAGSANSRN